MKSFAQFMFAAALYLQSLSAVAFGNEDVIQLLSAGFEEEIVLNAISASNPATFDTSATGLIGLKNAGASSAIIQKILARQATNGPARRIPDGMGSEDCRIESGGMENMIAIRADGKTIGLKPQQPGVSNDVDVATAFASVFTFGIANTRGSTSLVIQGDRASVRISERTPEFLDLLFPPGLSPADMASLVRMTIKDGSRTVQVAAGEMNISGYQGRSEISKDILVPVALEKVSDLCTWRGGRYAQYKMKPVAPLEIGEYGYLISGKVFDFGID